MNILRSMLREDAEWRSLECVLSAAIFLGGYHGL